MMSSELEKIPSNLIWIYSWKIKLKGNHADSEPIIELHHRSSKPFCDGHLQVMCWPAAQPKDMCLPGDYSLKMASAFMDCNFSNQPVKVCVFFPYGSVRIFLWDGKLMKKYLKYLKIILFPLWYEFI